MYITPIEILGEGLLKDFELTIKSNKTKITIPSKTTELNRDKAVWYIQYYTSNPNLMHLCPGGYLIYRDSIYYNATYAPVWGHPDLECRDCADYVSQALHFGGFPLEKDVWEPSVESAAWINVYELFSHFSKPNRGTEVASLMSLVPGDLLFIHNSIWEHVVMVSAINPVRYSAHTNDRKNYPYNTVFNVFLMIHYEGEIVFFPIVMKPSSKSFVVEETTQNPYPYPAPVDSKAMTKLYPYPAP